VAAGDGLNAPLAVKTMAQTMRQRYESERARHGYALDPAQEQVVALFERLRTELTTPAPTNLLSALLKRRSPKPTRGIYLWGGVGRGKTWLMDLFFHSLPRKDKQRSHFHRFMQSIHDELKKIGSEVDPMAIVAERIAAKTRVLCFDELFVTDIADAMLLGNLFRGLFERGVTLVSTSNVAPDGLYKDGLQRARFLPAIKLLKEHTQVVHLDSPADYRLRVLKQANTWFDAQAAECHSELERLFAAVAGEPGKPDSTLTLNHRRLKARRQADDVIWFEFSELCDGPRGQADYIEIARCFHTVFLSDVPVLGVELENQARRLVALVDEFYDRGVNLIVAAHAAPQALYRGGKLKFEFERTASRLIEMQSQEYLAREHRG
jgi:cell division protein ZapE